MNKISQVLFRENILLPLFICVVLPSMAGAWWRHSYGNVMAATAACDVSSHSAKVSLHDQ